MILRYIVEKEGTPTFTATSQCKLKIEAELKVDCLRRINIKTGYIKYSNFKLYTDDNIEICNL